MVWKQLLLTGDEEHGLVMGKGGALPKATSNDAADFLVVVPFNMTLVRLKATLKSAPTTDTTMQIRRSTDDGATFANAFGTVTIANGDKLGIDTPVSTLDVDEGDVLNFSITVGNGSGSNLAVMVVGKRR